MKRLTISILLQALLMLCSTVHAESSYVTIGNGTNSIYFYGYGAGYYSTTQTIYTAEEIGKEGYLTALAYNVATASAKTTTKLEIYLGITSKDAFDDANDGLTADELTLVFSGNPTLGSTTGWKDHVFQTKFSFDGTSNLVVVVCRESTADSPVCYYTYGYSKKNLYRWSYSSNTYSDIQKLDGYSTSSSYQNTRFKIESFPTITVNNINYTITSEDNKTVSVAPGSYSGIISIPTNVSHNGVEYAVKQIGKEAFKNCTSLSYVLINDGIENIGSNAFYGCTSLSSISIPSSVTSIANGAFQNCTNLKTVTVDGPAVEKTYTSSSNFTTIFGSQVTKYTIGANVTKVGDFAFYNASNVTSLSLGKNVKTLGGRALSGCSGLTSVTLPSGLSSIGGNAMQGCSGLTEISIPGSVTSIGSYAFSGCSSLTKAEFESVEAMCKIYFAGDYANPLNSAQHLYVNGTEVVDVIVPNTVESVGAYAFYNAKSIKSVSLPGSVTSIGIYAFYGCSSLIKAEFESVESLCNITFAEQFSNPLYYAKHLYVNSSEVTDIVVPNTVESIGAYAFYYAESIKSVSLPSSVKSIGSSAFGCCSSLTKAEFESVESLCNITFAEQFSNPLYYAKHLYVNGAEVIDVVVPNTISSINNKTFYNASSIESVSIPSSVTSIESNSFTGCSKLTTVAIDSPTLVEKTYSSSTNDNLPYLFGSQVTKFIIGDTPTKIGISAFYNKTGIKDVVLGKNIKTIGEDAFYGCTGLTSMELPEGLTTTGYHSFYNCSALTTLTLPSTLKTFGGYDFGYCDNLSNVYAYYITPPSISSGPFSSYGNLHVYKQMASKYATMKYWKDFTIVEDIDYQTVIGITFDQPNYTVEVGGLGELTCSVSPSNALLKDVTWSTEDNDIIFIDEKTGQFVGLSDGVATVKATSVDYNGFSATVQIFVGNAEREEAIMLSQYAMDLRINSSYRLTTTQVTNSGSDKPVTWSSDNTSVATVSNGTVTGVGEGTATITASIAGGKSATCTVNVFALKTTLADGSLTSYSNDVTEDYDEITYTRNFKNTGWQELYVPFAMNYNDWKNDFEVGYIEGFLSRDTDNDGEIDETIYSGVKITEGTLLPNTPYIIRAKTTGNKTITLNNATLYATEENYIDCSSTTMRYIFEGVYESESYGSVDEYPYYLNNSTFNRVPRIVPFRWTLRFESRGTSFVIYPNLTRGMVRDNDGTPFEEYVENNQNLFVGYKVYTLDGRMIDMTSETLKPGFYVKNGKKILVK